MKSIHIFSRLMIGGLMIWGLRAADGDLVLQPLATGLQVQIRGDDDEDWRLQGSTDLQTWADLDGFGTLVSGGTNAPWRALPDTSAPFQFFRARPTAGLFDPTLIRTFHL